MSQQHRKRPQNTTAQGRTDESTGTAPHASTPDELIANLPGLLGFYPEESLIVQGYYSRDDGSAYIGPTVRVDLSDELPFAEITRYLDNAECSFHVGFVVTTQLGAGLASDSGYLLEQLPWWHALRHAWLVDEISLMGCWLVEETRQGANYQLLFGSQILDDAGTPEIWRSGQVASVLGSPAMRPWSKRNELPSLTRDEAFAYLLGDKDEQRDEECASRTQRVLRTATQLDSREKSAQEEAAPLLAGIEASGLCAAELLKETDIVEAAGLWMTTTASRDEVMEVMVRHAESAQELLIAVVRSFSGLPRINALAVLAIVFLERDKVLQASQALTVALHEDPDHRMSQLLFAAVSAGAHDSALAAIKRAIRDENGHESPNAG